MKLAFRARKSIASQSRGQHSSAAEPESDQIVQALRDRGVDTIDSADVVAWSQILIDAVRAGGGKQPVSIGEGAWGVEVTGNENGFRVRDTAKLVDFLERERFKEIAKRAVRRRVGGQAG